MASIRQLNQAAPFWDFVSNMEEHGFAHPFFSHHPEHNHNTTDSEEQWPGRRGRHGRHGPHHRRHREHTPEDDEETIHEEELEESSSDSSDEEHDEPRDPKPQHDRKGHGRRGGFHGRGRGDSGRRRLSPGPGPRGFGPRGGPGPFFGHGGPGGREGPHGCGGAWGGFGGHHGFGPRGGFGFPDDFDLHNGSGLHRGHHHGFGARGGHGPHPYWGGRKHMRGFKHGRRCGPPPPPPGFGPWGRFGFQDNKHTEFQPEVDVYDTADAFLIHASLPGAKKDAVEVKWDPRKFELSISGVIERSGDEELLKALALDERRVGAFDRKVRLGSVAHPVELNANEIAAEMENGVLSVRLPKVKPDVVVVTKVDIQ
ncbi:Hsp20/alpha crystallin family protein [Aspergillus homomorphus CBS 101889]|uniref:HSP20-like chaperone n=1 Tax=Aspergillus homomorphus (strain CBS 101889) TaxID=1450537 RepID=A0A395HXE1_ASPHC|nr:HSP20-like chaperone [Aspergillus homomorphus CBS 101889]RAL12592.1 HSP20-like chaperone [Aspergillus homomorphus CBS 101889]